MKSKRGITLARIAALVVVVGISVYVFTIRDRAEQLALYGYPGIFLLALLSYATVILPAPGIAVVFNMASIFNTFWVAIAAGAGAALGELSGYLAGFSGQAVIERAELYERLTGWMNKNGPLTILFLSAIPNPFFDLAGIAAGALRMPIPKFLFWVWVGETAKMMFFAFAGVNVINRFL